jgi:hypothetical protein
MGSMVRPPPREGFPPVRECRRVFATNLVYVRIGRAGGVPCDGAVGSPIHLEQLCRADPALRI